MKVSAKVNSKELQAQLKKIATMGTPSQREQVLQIALFIIVDKAVTNLRTLGLWVTGTLAGAITSETRIEGDTVEGRVGTNLVYARIHELGGIIKAKNAKYLWYKLKDGSFRKSKQVTIPARPYLRPAFIESLPKVIDSMLTNLNKLLSDLI